MNKSAEPWIILDARAVMHHSFNMGKDPEGILGEDGELYNTAEFAFRNFLNRYMDEIFKLVSPRRVLVAMDGGIEYRRGLHPEYKLRREEKKKVRDAVAVEQSARFYKAMQGFWAATGCTVSRVSGVEADDLIAFFCERLPGKKLVYTTDGDLAALIQPKYDTVVKLKLEALVDDNYKGVPVGSMNLITVNKSMIGDTSDQYGGVKGFGPAKWEQLVTEFGHDGIQELEECVITGDFLALEEAIEACPDNKALQILSTDRENWKLQYELALLHPKLCEGTKNKKIIEIEWFKRIPNHDRLVSVLKEMFCDLTHLERYEDLCVQSWLLDSENLEDGDIEEAIEAFSNSTSVAFDYESQDAHYENFEKAKSKGNYVDIMTSKLAGASFCFGDNHQYCFYIPVNHKDSNNLSPEIIKQLLEGIPKDVPLVAHNNAFELAVTELNLNLELEGVHDTVIMSSYVDENKRAGLKSLSKEEFNYTQVTYSEVVGDNLGMFDVTAEEVLQYGCDDSITSAHLHDFYKMRMMLEGSWDFYIENEIYVQNPLTEAFVNGAEIDWDRLDSIHKSDIKIIKENTAFIREQLGINCTEENKEGTLSYIDSDIHNLTVISRSKARKAYDKKFPEGVEEAGKAARELWISDRINELNSEAQSQGIDLNQEELISMTNEEYEKKFSNISNADAGEAEKIKWVEAKVASDIKKFTDKAKVGSVYLPYSETIELPEFKPTLKTLANIATSLGITVPLESVAKSRISGWSAEVTDYDFDNKDAEDTNPLTPEQLKFVNTLVAASSELKKREGEAYEELKTVCAPYMADGKVIASGTELNLSSPAQLQHLLYCMLGLPVRLRSMPQMGSARQRANLEGSPGTDDLAIDTALAEDLQDVKDWRRALLFAVKEVKESSTRCSLYHTKYPLWRHPDDRRMHPQIRNCGTVTRRPSGTSPNILQVSKHQIDGAMRGVYLPHKEKLDVCTNIWIPYDEPTVIIAPDFSQQELRILASESGDKTMQSAYVGPNRKDIHSLTASGIAGMDYDKYNLILSDKSNDRYTEMSDIRKKPAKQTNFLIAYMGTAFTLAMKLIIPYDEADEMMEKTFALYPGIREWQEAMGEFARCHGYTQTAYGNRRHLNSRIFSTDNKIRKRIERQAGNSVIQGTAADILKIVLGEIHKSKLMKQTNSIMLAPIYDEIASSVPISKGVEYVNRLIDIMELTPPGHAVPMEADVSIGADWQLLKEIGVRPTEEAIELALEEAVKDQEEKLKARKVA